MIYEKKGFWKVVGSAKRYKTYQEALAACPDATCDACEVDPCECCTECGLYPCDCEENEEVLDDMEVHDRELFGREDS